MFGTHFYNEGLRKLTIAFGQLFNNIVIQNTSSTGAVTKRIRVPLAYAPKEKFIVRLEENASSRKVAITLPRLYFEMTSIDYDATRKTSPIQKYKTIIDGNGGEVRIQYVPVPYNLSFELGVIAKSQDDALQIVEQIFPFFTPQYTVSVKPFTNIALSEDVPITLTSVSFTDDFEGSIEQRRTIVYTLSFEMKINFHGPLGTSKIIREVSNNLFIIDSAADSGDYYKTQQITPTPANVTADSDYGFNTVDSDNISNI